MEDVLVLQQDQFWSAAGFFLTQLVSFVPTVWTTRSRCQISHCEHVWLWCVHVQLITSPQRALLMVELWHLVLFHLLFVWTQGRARDGLTSCTSGFLTLIYSLKCSLTSTDLGSAVLIWPLGPQLNSTGLQLQWDSQCSENCSGNSNTSSSGATLLLDGWPSPNRAHTHTSGLVFTELNQIKQINFHTVVHSNTPPPTKFITFKNETPRNYQTVTVSAKSSPNCPVSSFRARVAKRLQQQVKVMQTWL